MRLGGKENKVGLWGGASVDCHWLWLYRRRHNFTDENNTDMPADQRKDMEIKQRDKVEGPASFPKAKPLHMEKILALKFLEELYLNKL